MYNVNIRACVKEKLFSSMYSLFLQNIQIESKPVLVLLSITYLLFLLPRRARGGGRSEKMTSVRAAVSFSGERVDHVEEILR